MPHDMHPVDIFEKLGHRFSHDNIISIMHHAKEKKMKYNPIFFLHLYLINVQV